MRVTRFNPLWVSGNIRSTVTTENTVCVNQQIAFERFEKIDNIITGIYHIFKGAQNDKINNYT